nr:hypothetical protein CFP56_39669 [Quercus suber]
MKASEPRRCAELVARLGSNYKPSHAGHGFAASFARSDHGDYIGKRSDERRARDPLDGELRGEVCGDDGIEPSRRDKDLSDEYERGARG